MCFFVLAIDRGFLTGLNKAEQKSRTKTWVHVAVALGLGRNFVLSLSFIHDFHLTFLF